jgi:ketosteroid isomerase-like protein
MDDVERVRQGYEAFNRRDIPAILALLDPAIEYRMPMDPARRYPVFRGLQGAREFYESVFAAFELFEAEIESIRQFDDVVVAMGRLRARPRGSGEDQMIAFSHFWTVRDGRAVQVSFHDSANPFSVLESRVGNRTG